MVTGFIIKAEGHGYLEHRTHFWYPHASREDAFVYDADTVRAIFTEAGRRHWTIMPTHVIPATFDNGKVTVTGREVTVAEWIDEWSRRRRRRHQSGQF